MSEDKKKEITNKIVEIARKELGYNPIGIVLFVFQKEPEEKCTIIASGKWSLQPVLEFVLHHTP